MKFDGIAFPVYFMTAMATLGTMAAVISGSAIIAAERASGWTRQMRITPLPVRTYFRTKVIVAYLRALLTLVLLALAGTALGVRLPAQGWLTVLGLFLVGLIPFAVLGILLGHLIGADAAAPAVGGIVTLFALLGGVYGFEVATSGPVFARYQGAALVLAGAGREDRAGRARLAGRGLDRDRRLDRRPRPARGARLPPRHQPSLTQDRRRDHARH